MSKKKKGHKKGQAPGVSVHETVRLLKIPGLSLKALNPKP